MVNDLLRNPNEKFIRFILSELDLVGGRVTANVVERFAPIVKKSVQTALLGMVTKSMQQEIAPAPVTSTAISDLSRPIVEKSNSAVPAEALQHRATPAKAAVPVPATAEKEVAGIVTTEEELEIFRAVSRICADSAMKSPVKYKDGTNFFAINLGPVRSWFLRLFAGSRRKSFMARLPLGQAEPLAQGLQVEPVPENPDKCRVYFSTTADVEKLRSLILRAYEDAVRQKESGSADADDAAD